RRKHGEEITQYPHEATKPVLEATYGVIVYQEQVMQIANIVGGFSMSDADNLRKAMGKKKPEVMAKFKDQFIAGAIAQSYGEKFAKELFETMEYFAGYGFNKSHSTAYGLVTYQTAWLKAHYPIEFTAANLTVESQHSDKIKEFVDETRRAGIAILKPDINRSMRYFGVEDGAIRYGLGAIKGVGTRLADALADERTRSGEYASLEDLCERLDSTILNKTALEAFAQSGAFDALGRSRAGNFSAIESALRSSAIAREDRRRGQKMLFAAPAAAEQTDRPDTEEWPDHELLAREKESLGFYLSGHPFEKRGAFLRRIAGQSTATLPGLEPGADVRLAGMVSSVRVLQIKQGKNAGKKMAKFLLEDLDGQVAVTCFARTFETAKDRIVEDAIVFVSGRIDGNSEETALLLDQIEPAAEVVRREVAGIVLNLEGNNAADANLDRIAAIAERHRGHQHLLLDIADGDDCFRVRSDSGIHVTDELLDDLAPVVGPENMSFTRT
ncbi:MAG: DNA polymerase III subunit alpha, partial [Planctomycetes bacterium]|nr:DNA polymerase III subunit alpha [Planctomycetota bacterium]